jgi:hypothetical protein
VQLLLLKKKKQKENSCPIWFRIQHSERKKLIQNPVTWK